MPSLSPSSTLLGNFEFPLPTQQDPDQLHYWPSHLSNETLKPQNKQYDNEQSMMEVFVTLSISIDRYQQLMNYNHIQLVSKSFN